MAKIVIAPDKYKGCLTSPQVCDCIAAGLRAILDDTWAIETCPQADGGEGTVEAVVRALDGELKKSSVTGPRGSEVEATWGWIPDTEAGDNLPAAVIEMAAASGLALLDKSQRDPMLTTTYGTGDIILQAARAGAKEVLLGIGGSATVDGGTGVAEALGFKLLDADGNLLEARGGNLGAIKQIDDSEVPEAVKKLNIKVACDVTNPLLGERGAALVYGPQKGADSEAVPVLEENMLNWASVVENYAGKKLRDEPGTGAAGGLGFGLMGLLGAELTSGARLVVELTGLSRRLKNADVLITGEGAFDEQTAFGKTPAVVAQAAQEAGVDFIVALAGAMQPGYRKLYDRFDLLLGLPRRPLTLEESLEQARDLLKDWGEDIGRIIKVTEKMKG